MQFRTKLQAQIYPFKIDYSTNLFFIGSCFSDNISKNLIEGGFSVTANPFGVLYNPFSIKNAFDILLSKKCFLESDLILHNGLYHSFSHHGSFSRISKKEALNIINSSVKTHADILKASDCIFITFGTSYVYRYFKTKKIVSNCHKIPAKEFEHFRLSITEIVSEYKILLTELKQQNPNLKIIFTVSPVRHWKDGAHENQLSKATLHLAIEELQKQFNFVYYYPSFELIMDDLRDYRFYTEDMLHINSQAVDYIYNHFRKSFYSEEILGIEKQVLKLKQALNHRPFNLNTKEHLEFVEKTKQKIEQLKSRYTDINI